MYWYNGLVIVCESARVFLLMKNTGLHVQANYLAYITSNFHCKIYNFNQPIIPKVGRTFLQFPFHVSFPKPSLDNEAKVQGVLFNIKKSVTEDKFNRFLSVIENTGLRHVAKAIWRSYSERANVYEPKLKHGM